MPINFDGVYFQFGKYFPPQYEPIYFPACGFTNLIFNTEAHEINSNFCILLV